MNSTFAAFQDGANRLGSALASVAFVLAVAGLVYCTLQGMQERHLGRIKGHLVRIIVAAILLGSFTLWTTRLNDAALTLVEFDTVADAYRTAVLQRFGSQSAAASGGQQRQGQPSSTAPQQPATGVKITRYGYEQPGDPNYDSNSGQGIGAFPFDSTPGSLGRLVNAAALSPDVAAQYNVQPGQQFPITVAGGQQITITYADKTGNDPLTGQPLTGRIDLYDPAEDFSGIDGAQVTAIGDASTGPPAAGSGFNPLNPLTYPGALREMLTEWLASVISGIGLFVMYLVKGIQKVFLLIEVAVAPIFIGLLCIAPLAGAATRFFMGVIATCIWPLGIMLANLVTKAMIDLAVGASTGVRIADAANTVARYSGVWWIVIGLWVVFSGFFAPFVITFALLSRSSTNFAAMITGMLGAGSMVLTSPVIRTGATVAGTTVPAAATEARAMWQPENHAKRPIQGGETA